MVAGVADGIGTRARALARVVPPHSVVVDLTAAWLWGIDLFPLQEDGAVPRVDVFRLRGSTRIRRTPVRGGQRDLAARDVTLVEGVAVTTPVRTALDLACLLGPFKGLAALDAFAQQHGVTREELETELPRYRRRRGVVTARAIVPLVDHRSESTGESFTRWPIAEAGLPLPESQYWVLDDDGRPIMRLDLAYPDAKICVEYDGEEFHTRPEHRVRDRERRRWLREHGWYVIVLTKESFTPAARAAWVAELRNALEDRGVVL